MNKYQILDIIDEGAYGIVWKAVNRQTNVLVAIKEFKEGDDDQIAKAAIQREIKMLKMLKGQYVVQIKEAFKKKGKIYLIFQFFEKNILNLIQLYETGLDPNLIKTIIYKSVKCLKFLHNKNIIHRDIKPENILINNTYTQLKLCDFGFARFMPTLETADLTEYVATRWYRSPQLLVGEFYGKPADIWALGCILGELVDGQPMFPGQNQMDQLFLIKKTIGSLTQRQMQYLTKNPKFIGMDFPPMRKQQNIETKYLGRIQKPALNFLKQCLNVDPMKRITVEQALQHPYLIELSSSDLELQKDDEQNLLLNQRKKHSIMPINVQQYTNMKSPQLLNNEEEEPSHREDSQQKTHRYNYGEYKHPQGLHENDKQRPIDKSKSKSIAESSTHANSSSLINNQTKSKILYHNSESKQSYKYSLKMPGIAGGSNMSSLPEKQIFQSTYGLNNKKKSHDYYNRQRQVTYSQQQPQTLSYNPKSTIKNLNNKNHASHKNFSKQLSPKLKIKKDVNKKLLKMMSQQKNLNLNVDLNFKINLKIKHNSNLNQNVGSNAKHFGNKIEKGERIVKFDKIEKATEHEHGKLPQIAKNIGQAEYKNNLMHSHSNSNVTNNVTNYLGMTNSRTTKYQYSFKQNPGPSHASPSEKYLHPILNNPVSIPKTDPNNLSILGESKYLTKNTKKL